MDLRQPKPNICDALEIGETLETFKAGRFPTTEDVLRHFYYHFELMEKNQQKLDANIASQKTAESLIAHLAPSALPLKPKEKVKGKVKSLYECFCKVRNGERTYGEQGNVSPREKWQRRCGRRPRCKCRRTRVPIARRGVPTDRK